MNSYERIISEMRKQGARYNPPAPVIGVVQGRGRIKIDSIDLELDEDDYLIDCNLRLDDTEKVYYHTRHTASGQYLTDGEHNGTLKEHKDNVLRTGDRVLAFKLENFEKYIIIAKVVKPV